MRAREVQRDEPGSGERASPDGGVSRWDRREREREERADKERMLEANRAMLEKIRATQELTSSRARKLLDEAEEDLENVDRSQLLEMQNEVAAAEQEAKERKQKEVRILDT